MKLFLNSPNDKQIRSGEYYVGLSRALNKLSGKKSSSYTEQMNLSVNYNSVICPCCRGRFPEISKIKEEIK